MGADQGQRGRRHHRGRSLKHLRAGSRRARDDARKQIRRAHGRPAHREVRPRRPFVPRASAGCRRPPTPSCRSPSWASRRPSCAPTSTATTRSAAGPSWRRSSRGSPACSTAHLAPEPEHTTPRLVEPATEDELQRPLRRQPLDRLPAHRPAHRGARRRDAGGHTATSLTRSSATCSRRITAATGSTPSRRSP